MTVYLKNNNEAYLIFLGVFRGPLTGGVWGGPKYPSQNPTLTVQPAVAYVICSDTDGLHSRLSCDELANQ